MSIPSLEFHGEMIAAKIPDAFSPGFFSSAETCHQLHYAADAVAFCDQFSVCGRVSALPDEPAELINSVRIILVFFAVLAFDP